MNGWEDGWGMDRWMVGLMDAWMDGRMDKRMDRGINGWMGGRNGWML